MSYYATVNFGRPWAGLVYGLLLLASGCTPHAEHYTQSCSASPARSTSASVARPPAPAVSDSPAEPVVAATLSPTSTTALNAAASQAMLNKDYPTALQDSMVAVAEGDPTSACDLGVMYFYGDGVPRDDVHLKQSSAWFTQAGDAGNLAAQDIMGYLYLAGYLGVSPVGTTDYKDSIKWLTLAATQGDSYAEANLGVAYAVAGHGVTPNGQQSLHWLNLAAQQHSGLAEATLGVMYGSGYLVTRDDAIAAKYMLQGAEDGNLSAQKRLVTIYELGRGVPQSNANAYYWCRITAIDTNADVQITTAQTTPWDKHCYELGDRLTADQATQIQHQVTMFVNAAQKAPARPRGQFVFEGRFDCDMKSNAQAAITK